MIVLPARYQDTDLSGSALISDPPYGARTHKGHNEGHKQTIDVTGQETRRAINYDPWTPADVAELVKWSADRITGWRACFTSHDLINAYSDAYESIGLYAFAPVGVIIPRPRLLGDGPASWLVYLMVARPRTKEFSRWRCLPGSYRSSCETRAPIVGAKRIELLAELIRDYTNPGDKVIDPCAGWGSTLVSALLMGRGAAGAERDPEAAAAANERIESALLGEIAFKPPSPATQREIKAMAAAEKEA